MIDIRTTHPNGGLQTTTNGGPTFNAPGVGGGGFSPDLDFFKTMAMRGMNLKEQAARQRMAQEAQQAQMAAEDRQRGISEHSQARNAAQRDSIYASNRDFQFTHSRPDLASGMAQPADYNRNTGEGMRTALTGWGGSGPNLESYADEMDQKRRQQQQINNQTPNGGNLFG